MKFCRNYRSSAYNEINTWGENFPLLAACNSVRVMFPDERTNDNIPGDMAIAYTVYACINHELAFTFWMQRRIFARLDSRNKCFTKQGSIREGFVEG